VLGAAVQQPLGVVDMPYGTGGVVGEIELFGTLSQTDAIVAIAFRSRDGSER